VTIKIISMKILIKFIEIFFFRNPIPKILRNIIPDHDDPRFIIFIISKNKKYIWNFSNLVNANKYEIVFELCLVANLIIYRYLFIFQKGYLKKCLIQFFYVVKISIRNR
jgi:hypothetical protein